MKSRKNVPCVTSMFNRHIELIKLTLSSTTNTPNSLSTRNLAKIEEPKEDPPQFDALLLRQPSSNLRLEQWSSGTDSLDPWSPYRQHVSGHSILNSSIHADKKSTYDEKKQANTMEKGDRDQVDASLVKMTSKEDCKQLSDECSSIDLSSTESESQGFCYRGRKMKRY
jgi:hypothetical protein